MDRKLALLSEEIREAAVRPIVRSGRGFYVLAIFLGIIVAGGVAAYIYQLTNGLVVTGLSDDVFWGFYLTDLVAIIGVSYGGAVVSAILRLTDSSWRAPITRLAEAMALVTLVIGAMFAIIHVGSPDRLFWLLLSPNPTSPVFWDVIAISSYLMATVIFFYLPLIPDLAVLRDRFGEEVGRWRKKLYTVLSLGWQGLPQQRKLLSWASVIMAILIIPLAVSVHSVLSFAFALTSREGWHSTIYAPYFVVAALFSGVALVVLVVVAFRKAYHLEKQIGEKQIRYISYLMVVLGSMYLYFTFSEFLTEGFVQTHGAVLVLETYLLSSSYSPLFWLFAIGGIIIPILLVANPGTRKVPWLTLAAALVVASMWLKRLLIVVPPLRLGLFGAETVPYSGSWVETAITLAALAAIPLLLMLISRLFPVLSIYEMEEVLEEESEHQSGVQLKEGAGND